MKFVKQILNDTLISTVMGVELINGKELQDVFGYISIIKTKCLPPIPDDKCWNLSDTSLTYGWHDKRPGVLKNIPEGVKTHNTINIYEFMERCKLWAITKNYYIATRPLRIEKGEPQNFRCVTYYNDGDYENDVEWEYGDTELELVLKSINFIINELKGK